MVTKTPLRITMESQKQEANEFPKRSRDYALGSTDVNHSHARTEL